MPILFSVTNSRTDMTGADPFILHVLDAELRYPTQVAHLQDSFAMASDQLLDQFGNWDGWNRLLHRPRTIPPWFPTGLLSTVLRICDKMQYAYSVTDLRERPVGDIPELVKIDLWDHQEEAVNRGLELGFGVFDLPPRSGKTRLACELHRRLAVPTLWIAPTDRIVRQTHKVLEGFFGKNYAMHLVGSKREQEAGNFQVVVATAAMAFRLSPEFFKTRKCLIVDEFHHSGAKTYKTIFSQCNHIYHRFGLTGTYFRSGTDAMAMHALLSDVVYKISSDELMRRGYLVPCFSAFVPVPCPHLRGVPSQSFISGHGKMGIHEHEVRNSLVAYTALFLHQTGRKILILVGTKKQGYMIRKALRSLVLSNSKAQFNATEFVSTDVDRRIQGQILESFEQGQEVKILIGTSLLGEGVDLPTTDALVYARGESAEVTLTQAIYRVSTAVPGKTHAVVVDFGDRHHRHLLRHSKERLKVYFEEPTFEVKVLNEVGEFPLWLDSAVPKVGESAT